METVLLVALFPPLVLVDFFTLEELGVLLLVVVAFFVLEEPEDEEALVPRICDALNGSVA